MRWFVVAASFLFACGDHRLAPWDAAASNDGAIDAPSDAAIDTPADAGIGIDWNEGATSGTRLKLVWYRTPDGVKTWLGTGSGPGYYDSLRGEDCIPEAWSDGTTRCTPGGMQVMYADAACTMAVGQWSVPSSTCPSADTPPPAYVADAESGCTPSRSHLYQRGAPVTLTRRYTRDLTTGACTGPLSNSTEEYFALGPEVPPDDFATMTLGAPEGTGSLQLVWWRSNDGLRALAHGYDVTLNDLCTPFMFYTGTPVCFPRSTRSNWFQDASCTQREIRAPTGCTEPTYAFTVTNTTCPKETATFYTTGAAASSSAVYWQPNATCTTATANAADTYYSLAAQFTPTTVQYQTDSAPGLRLLPHHFTAPDFSFRNATLYDTTFGAECELTKLYDGSIACLPSTLTLARRPTVVSAFADAACTMPITVVEVYIGDSGCAPIVAPTLATGWDSSSGCNVPDVRLRGAALSSPIYLGSSGGPCTAYSDPRFAFYDGSTQVPVSALGTATRVVDP